MQSRVFVKKFKLLLRAVPCILHALQQRYIAIELECRWRVPTAATATGT